MRYRMLFLTVEREPMTLEFTCNDSCSKCVHECNKLAIRHAKESNAQILLMLPLLAEETRIIYENFEKIPAIEAKEDNAK